MLLYAYYYTPTICLLLHAYYYLSKFTYIACILSKEQGRKRYKQ